MYPKKTPFIRYFVSPQQSRYFDPNFNKALTPRPDAHMVELKQKGQIVVINVKKDKDGGYVYIITKLVLKAKQLEFCFIFFAGRNGDKDVVSERG